MYGEIGDELNTSHDSLELVLLTIESTLELGLKEWPWSDVQILETCCGFYGDCTKIRVKHVIYVHLYTYYPFLY